MKSFLLLACVLIFCAASFAQSAPPSGDPEANRSLQNREAVLEAVEGKRCSGLG